MLMDAGDVDREGMSKNAPLRLLDPRPDASRRAGEWIVDYIRHFAPTGQPVRLDYAVISHFHSDHFGHLSPTNPRSTTDSFRLTGIMDVAEAIPIGTLIDRAAPEYRAPVDLKACPDGMRGALAKYFKLVDSRIAHGQAVEGLQPGRTDQIILRNEPNAYANFSIRNVAASGVLWTGRGSTTFRYIPSDAVHDCNFNENPFSLAIKLSYGSFDYYAGGDLTGASDSDQPYWLDVETPVGRAVGPVDVMTLNHHGNRDATTANFLRTLQPRVIVQQSWVSDQPGGEVVHRMTSQSIYPGPRDIFATGIRPETRIAIGPWMERAYSSFDGHVVVRVAAGGNSYQVFVLDDMTRDRNVKRVFGPYAAN
ncbi:MAG: metallohydrolase [Sphingomonas sp.]|nr:MAG: metallohydrolase [Sphingomonas sp.]